MPLMTSLVVGGCSVSVRGGLAGSEAAGPSAGEAPVAAASPAAATPKVPPRGSPPPANAAADVPVPSRRRRRKLSGRRVAVLPLRLHGRRLHPRPRGRRLVRVPRRRLLALLLPPRPAALLLLLFRAARRYLLLWRCSLLLHQGLLCHGQQVR